MSAYLTFQSLPLHIAEKIFDYMFCNLTRCSPFWHNKIENKHTLAALYEISQRWRNIVLRYFYNLIKLTLSKKKLSHYWRFLDILKPIEDNKTNSLLYVENVWIRIGRSYLHDTNSGIQLLADIWPSSYIFPSARRVLIEYGDDYQGNTTNSAEVEDKVISAIIQQIFSQMPKLQEVYIDCSTKFNCKSDVEYQSVIGSSMDRILMMALSKVKKLHVTNASLWSAHIPSYTNLNAGLTYLEFGDSCNSDICSHIIKRNATTLNTLVSCFYMKQIDQYLLFDEGGNAIAYSRLEALELKHNPDDVVIYRHKVDEAVVPFPVLKRLFWEGLYPFEDDTLFRGNGNTLTYLSMEADKSFRQVAQKYKIFYKGSHPNLQHITSICNSSEYDSEEPNIDTQLYMQSTLDLVSPTTQVLNLLSLDDMQIFLRAIPGYPHMTSIRVLKIYPIGLRLIEAIVLLKSLPTLSYLCSNLKGLGTGIDAVNCSSLPEHLCSLYYPLSDNLNIFCVSSPMDYNEQFLLPAILLAILCPRLNFISSYLQPMGKYFKERKYMFSTEPYKKYAERVQHLFRG
ncbi:hypothetical protein BX070DRAFT_220027 [Coemansia spiralis]|nr:hypothetical protein BX070DRAFT_220027 [Coemansia spiralis]